MAGVDVLRYLQFRQTGTAKVGSIDRGEIDRQLSLADKPGNMLRAFGRRLRH
jgi:hypothetical protein